MPTFTATVQHIYRGDNQGGIGRTGGRDKSGRNVDQGIKIRRRSSNDGRKSGRVTNNDGPAEYNIKRIRNENQHIENKGYENKQRRAEDS